MARIYIENLSGEYRKKLCARQLSRETIDRLAVEVSEKYQLRWRTFKWLAVLLPAGTALMLLLTLKAPAADGVDRGSYLAACGFTILAELGILAAAYFLAVVRVPRQFARCLKKGYPELEPEYGCEQLLDGSLTRTQGAPRPSVTLRIEEIFPLQGSEDVVAAGFAQGLIVRGSAVRIAGPDGAPRAGAFALVKSLEKAEPGGAVGAAEAADCRAALRLEKGARLGLAPGMILYRE